jgi:UV damage endonuclease UvdE
MTTFNHSIRRIGFACKPSVVENGVVTPIPEMNCKTTTLAWLNRQPKKKAEEKLWDLLKHNIQSIYNSFKFIAKQPHELRMFRISSDIIPVYNHHDWHYFYQSNEVQNYMESNFKKVGEFAKANDIRISFHPDQFVVLASDKEDVVNKSIKEFEYHCDIARMMGYGQKFQDIKINVHISGKQGPEGIKKVMSKLSSEARNSITIENDEITWGIDASLELVDTCPLVLDIHHHWVATGEYIQPDDDRIKRFIDSWRGCRPVIHYSISREDLLLGHCNNTLPDHNLLLKQGFTKQKLRAHSDYFWNKKVNDWAMSHNFWADIMCESKAKNLASFELYNTYVKGKINVEKTNELVMG